MKLILHIGTEKTGTTSIQQALAVDRDRLAGQGILFPRLFGSSNHMELAVAAMTPSADDELQMIELGRQSETHEEYIQRLRAQLRSEIAQSGVDQVLLSNEHCHSRLRDPAAIARILSLFDTQPQEVEIFVYLRRQDRLAVSLHSTRLKGGGNDAVFPRTDAGPLPYYFDFEKLLNNYAQVFGAQSLRVRLYERAHLLDGDVVHDFYQAAGLGIQSARPPAANKSLSVTQSRFLELFNEIFPLIADGRLNTQRGPIYDAIRNAGKGDSYRPARAAAQNFYDPFRVGNAAVRAAHFPDLDRETLFDEDFSEYPEATTYAPMTEAEFMEFVAAIWRYYMATRRS